MLPRMFFISLISLASWNTTVLGQEPLYVPSSDLIGWWSFSGNANDESGNGFNGTVQNASLTPDRFDISDMAYGFEGIDNIIEINNSDQVSFTNGFSLAVWVHFNQFPETSESIIASRQLDVSENAIGFVVSLSASGFYNFRIGNGNIDTYSLCSTPAFQGEWTHLVFTYGNGIQAIYKDGILSATTTQPNAEVGTAGVNLWFGGPTWEGAESSIYFMGELDDIGLWTRALSEEEITQLFGSCWLIVNEQASDQLVQIGTTANFTVSAVGADLTYQWQLNDGLGWQNLFNDDQYAGVDSSSLTIALAEADYNGYFFRCVVGSGICVVESDAAVLTICNLQITTNPVDQTGDIGQSVEFFVETNLADVTFQWQTNQGIGWLDLFDAGQYDGTTTDNLTISSINALNDNQIFRNIIGGDGCTDTTTIATLDVNEVLISQLNISAFSIWYDPSSFTLQIINSFGPLNYQLFDSSGSVIDSGEIDKNKTSITMDKLPIGLYLVVFNLKEQAIQKSFVVCD